VITLNHHSPESSDWHVSPLYASYFVALVEMTKALRKFWRLGEKQKTTASQTETGLRVDHRAEHDRCKCPRQGWKRQWRLPRAAHLAISISIPPKTHQNFS